VSVSEIEAVCDVRAGTRWLSLAACLPRLGAETSGARHINWPTHLPMWRGTSRNTLVCLQQNIMTHLLKHREKGVC